MNKKNILTWSLLKSWNYKKPFPNFRTDETLQKYQQFKNNNVDIPSYIQQKYLKNKNYTIEKNAFPYHTEKNVEHYVLWINKNFEKHISISKTFLENIIKEKMILLEYNEYIYFENHVSVKTIPQILHYQIFFKKF